MKTMMTTVGICLAMALAGCAQKSESSANLAAFDDTSSAASCCSTKAAASCSSAKAASSCCSSKAAQPTCPMSTKMSTEVN